MANVVKLNCIRDLHMRPVSNLQAVRVKATLSIADRPVLPEVQFTVPNHTQADQVIEFMTGLYTTADPVSFTINIAELMEATVNQVSAVAQGTTHAAQMETISKDIAAAMIHLNVANDTRLNGISNAHLRAHHFARTCAIALAEQAAGQAEMGLLMVLGQLRAAGSITTQQHATWAHDICFGRFKIDVMRHGHKERWFF